MRNTNEFREERDGFEGEKTPEVSKDPLVGKLRANVARVVLAAMAAGSVLAPKAAEAEEHHQKAATTDSRQVEKGGKKIKHHDHPHHKNALSFELGRSFTHDVMAVHLSYSRVIASLIHNTLKLHLTPGVSTEFGKFGESEKGEKYYTTPAGMEVTWKIPHLHMVELAASIGGGGGVAHMKAEKNPNTPALGGALVESHNVPFVVAEGGGKIYVNLLKTLEMSFGIIANAIYMPEKKRENGLYFVGGVNWKF